jgi:hypothetical protein
MKTKIEKNKKDNPKQQKILKNRLIVIMIAAFSLFLYVIVSIYFFTLKDTGTSYSITQTYKSYFGIEDWNLIKHAFVDIDGDGKQDMVTFSNCAFLTATLDQKIPEDKKCEEPGMSPIGFPNGEKKIGQKLISNKPYRYTLLTKSYLVKTQNDTWKFYDTNGYQIRTYELKPDGLFYETSPSLLDRVDVFTYQTGHFGVMLILAIGSIYFH